MRDGVFDGIWDFGRSLTAHFEEEKKSFRGFIEPLSLTDCVNSAFRKPGHIPKERFRLLAEPVEALFQEGLLFICCGNEIYRLLTVKKFFKGERLTHLECILLKTGEGDGKDA